MSLENIRALETVLENAIETNNKLFHEACKNDDEKRTKALSEIRAYLDELCDILNERTFSISLGNLVFDDGQSNLTINDYSQHDTDTCCKWIIKGINAHKTSDTDYYNYIDSTNDLAPHHELYWAPGSLELIKNWEKIKSRIEEEICNQLNDMISNVEQTSISILEERKYLEEFKV